MRLLKTQRATLRPFNEADFTELEKMMSDEEVMRFTGFGEVQNSDQVKKLLSKWIKKGESPLGVWAAVDNESDAFIGWFMLQKTICDDPEIGFMLPTSKWGKGYATEISEKLLDYAFNTLGFKRVIASTNPKNSSANKVARKLGMVESKDIFQKDLCYFEKYK